MKKILAAALDTLYDVAMNGDPDSIAALKTENITVRDDGALVWAFPGQDGMTLVWRGPGKVITACNDRANPQTKSTETVFNTFHAARAFADRLIASVTLSLLCGTKVVADHVW